MIPRSTFIRHLVTSAALLLAGAPVFAQTALPLAELGAGMYRIEAEVAHTFETRQVGLMNRAAMPLHRGMVFVFPEARLEGVCHLGFDAVHAEAQFRRREGGFGHGRRCESPERARSQQGSNKRLRVHLLPDPV